MEIFYVHFSFETSHIHKFISVYHVMKTYPVINQAPRREDSWRSGGVTPLILNRGTIYR